jgi:hypothetical protein
LGKALVQLSASGLRERVVGGVTYKKVAEAVSVVTRQLSSVRADKLFAHQCNEPFIDVVLA